MKCPVESTLLVDFLESELDPRMVPVLEEHLLGCDACRKELEALRGVRRMLGRGRPAAADAEPPESFWRDNLEAVADLTYRKTVPLRQKIHLSRLHPGILAAAAVVLLALIGTFRLGLFRDTPVGSAPVAAARQENLTNAMLADSLYRLAETVYRYNQALELYESITELSDAKSSEAGDMELAVPPGNSVYDGLADLNDRQLEEVGYALAGN
ncbi:MAG: hypothetical protein A3F83_10465 [Candidatus Glassbacteria bacterium RIFCSPLOWO2_12_FULL_58_11]|uniref:Putative zinc-finger domain-containing protein n=1 Tax=Candidatus Glassbacteria bacterium RIFCSPLOWO2_12_FULL_58_11 TaxID=1817867 RepID=A0A1F5YZ18_9BACT|nr:MAG: hypothetical protein A3F83_10465 [Candidatus Glassbacteria bacterium RIFCSPLOWO2_12_FULL_58_11]